MIDWLKNEWQQLMSNYCDTNLSEKLWNEIQHQYSLKNRHYHNLTHIYNMLNQIESFKNDIKDLEALKLSVWYHDVVYKASKGDNEEQSALIAEKHLKSINFEKNRIEIIKKLIISTKKHAILLNDNHDNGYLLDTDLSILGTDWETYKNYTLNIRKEYKIYPDFIYNPGRKKVLNHFLERDTLYFTKTYQAKFEKQARENLKKELSLL